jgi:hypothetical protein
MKVDTISLKGNDYATVPQRLKHFRQDNPRAIVETTPTIDGTTIIFKAHIVKDKTDAGSAEATGHSYGENKGDKAFEKLETVAVGRALSLLGYLNNGQIASTEEMVEFEEYKEHQWQEIVDSIKSAEKREEFSGILTQLTPEQKKLATPIINNRIKELQDAATN